jgi:NTP pyrophosphatase (non-canonical NTP hydrolase)
MEIASQHADSGKVVVRRSAGYTARFPAGGAEPTAPCDHAAGHALPPRNCLHTMTDISLREIQQNVDQWIRSTGVCYFSELTNLAQLVEEVGELARILSRTFGDQSFKAGESADLADEMADVLFVVVCLANQTGVDLTDALQKNLAKKTARDADRHRDNPKLAGRAASASPASPANDERTA